MQNSVNSVINDQNKRKRIDDEEGEARVPPPTGLNDTDNDNLIFKTFYDRCKTVYSIENGYTELDIFFKLKYICDEYIKNTDHIDRFIIEMAKTIAESFGNKLASDSQGQRDYEIYKKIQIEKYDMLTNFKNPEYKKRKFIENINK